MRQKGKIIWEIINCSEQEYAWYLEFSTRDLQKHNTIWILVCVHSLGELWTLISESANNQPIANADTCQLLRFNTYNENLTSHAFTAATSNINFLVDIQKLFLKATTARMNEQRFVRRNERIRP